jgi:hypothetical protein
LRSRLLANPFRQPETPNTLAAGFAGVDGIPYSSWIHTGVQLPTERQFGEIDAVGGDALVTLDVLFADEGPARPLKSGKLSQYQPLYLVGEMYKPDSWMDPFNTGLEATGDRV